MSEFGQIAARRAGSKDLVMPAFPGLPPLPHERRPKDKDLRVGKQVVFLYYRSWMDEPELSVGRIDSRSIYARPRDPNPGFVNLKTARTNDNRTGSLIGVNMHSVALIPRAAWAHLMTNHDYFEAWMAGGSVAWPEERDQLEELLLAERSGEGHINWRTDTNGHRDETGAARLHAFQSFAVSGKVLPHPPAL